MPTQDGGLCTDFTWRDLTAGNALFTLVDVTAPEGASRFTYQIAWFDVRNPRTGAPTGERKLGIELLAGPDNTRDFKRIGVLERELCAVVIPASSQVRESAPSVKMLKRFVGALCALDRVPTGMQVWLAGHCLRCGRRLTVPASVSMKYGPDCLAALLSA